MTGFAQKPQVLKVRLWPKAVIHKRLLPAISGHPEAAAYNKEPMSASSCLRSKLQVATG